MRKEIVERELTKAGPKRGGRARPGARSVTVNLAESPISWLYARGHIDERQYQAGELLRNDYEHAQMSPNVTMRWDLVRISGTRRETALSSSERVLAAKKRLDAALLSAGPGLQDVLWRVVCDGRGLPETEKDLSWPARSGKLVLKLALDRVAQFYRLT